MLPSCRFSFSTHELGSSGCGKIVIMDYGSRFRERTHELAERLSPVADRMLMFWLELAERLLVTDGNEHRIIAEAAVAARRPDERAVDAAVEGFGLAVIGPRDGEGTGEVGGGRGVGLG